MKKRSFDHPGNVPRWVLAGKRIAPDAERGKASGRL